MPLQDHESYPFTLSTLPNGAMPSPEGADYLTDDILRQFREAAARARSRDSALGFDRDSAERQAREMEEIVRRFRGPPPQESERTSEFPAGHASTFSPGGAAYLTDEISRQFRGGAPYVKDNGDPILNGVDQFGAERQARERDEIVRRFRGPPPSERPDWRHTVGEFLEWLIDNPPDAMPPRRVGTRPRGRFGR